MGPGETRGSDAYDYRREVFDVRIAGKTVNVGTGERFSSIK